MHPSTYHYDRNLEFDQTTGICLNYFRLKIKISFRYFQMLITEYIFKKFYLKIIENISIVKWRALTAI